MARSGATQEEVRRHNLATLLTHVHVEGATSRARLTARMGLNRSTIGGLVAELASAGLLREQTGEAGRVGRTADTARLGAGRPSHVVVPECERVFVLAVDVGVAHLQVARVGLGGAVLARRRRAHERGHHELEAVVRVVARMCRELLAQAPRGSACVGVGAGVPGAVRREDGLVRFGPNLGWTDEPFGAVLSERLGLPVHVANDADLGVLAERLRGAALGCDDVVYLAGGVGVGGGIIVGGRLLAGQGGYAGEVGHLVLNPSGRRCRCGARGCWETEIGEDALLVPAGRPPGGGTAAVREVLVAAADGDEDAGRALATVASWLGTGVGVVVNLLNPEVVVFGGALSEVFGAAEPQIRAALAGSALAAPREQVRLVLPALGSDSSLLGAAELAFAPLLDDPIETLAAGSARRPAGRRRPAAAAPPA